jgi:hypothetical protein
LKRALVSGITVTFVLVLLASCGTAPPARAPEAKAAAAEEKIYEGAGRDASLLGAMNGAKMDAVRKAVIDLIGAENEQAHREQLSQVLYGTSNPNAFVNNETFETTRKDKSGEEYIIEARVAVKLRAVESTLRANGLLGEAGGAQASGGAAAAVAAAESEGAEQAAEPAGEEPTAAEARFINRYVDNMTYMVYFSEEAGEDPFYMKAAVGIANEYLTSNAIEAIDLEQVEKLKKDQQMVYEEETGESISIIQWIAQKLNADIYVEIDARTSGETSGGKYYGQANVTVKGFEASTGRLLGSQPWNSPKTYSTSSEEAARINALQTSVYKAMPLVIEQAKAYMSKALRNGLKYELIVQRTSDARLMNDFRRKLQRKVKDIRTVSQTEEQTSYEVYLIGDPEDLVDLVYDVAETVPGLEGIYQVLLRGKSITFNTGL